MNLKLVSSIAIVLVVTAAGTATFLQPSSDSTVRPFPMSSGLKAGTHFTITKNDGKMMGGTEMVSFQKNGYYAIEYSVKIVKNSIITGSWNSTGESIIWVLIDRAAYMETPFPDATSGILNQTLTPGQYTLVIGGHPGDVISISSSIEIRNSKTYQVSDLYIPSGTHIDSQTTYPFHLNQSGELVGTLATPPGDYTLSMYSSAGLGFTTACSNSSAVPSTISFSYGPNSQVYGPGNYNITFSGGFYVKQTVEFLYYCDNSSF